MVKTGILGVDELLDGGLHRGALHVVAGEPKSGMTAFLRRIIQAGLNQGKKVWVCDTEGDLTRHFEGQPHFTAIASFAVNPTPDNCDLVVFDNVMGLFHTLEEPSSTQGQRWLANVVLPRIQSWDDSSRANPFGPVTVMSWRMLHRGREDGDVLLRMPRILGHQADVVFELLRPLPPHRGVDFRIIKNRFGCTGLREGYTLPDFQPIHRPTIWERLNASTRTEP